MKRITDWIRRHQVLAFFILAYAISWSVLLLYFPFAQRDPTGGVLIEPLVFFSPALMAMLISGIAEPLPTQKRGRPRWIAFFVSWLISATVLSLYAWKVYRVERRKLHRFPFHDDRLGYSAAIDGISISWLSIPAAGGGASRGSGPPNNDLYGPPARVHCVQGCWDR